MGIKKILAACVVVTGGLFTASASYAVNLMEAYEQALVSDPSLRSARFASLADKAGVAVALSPLLPQGVYSYQTSYNGTKQLSETSPSLRGNDNYNSHGWTLSLSQTIFDYVNWRSFQEAQDVAKASLATYNSTLQELMVRTSKAYFDVLLAQDILRYTVAEKKAVWQQLDQTEQQYKVGLIAVTGVYQARAAYDDILAEEITAKNNIVNAQERLRQITGEIYDVYAGLGKTVPLIAPDPINPDEWETIALQQNYSIKAARYTVQASRENLQEQYGDFLPTVVVVGSGDYINEGPTADVGNTDSQTLSAGIQMQWNFLSGGLGLASVKQAGYLSEQASADLETVLRSVIDQTRESYNDVVAGISRIEADKQAIISNESSLQSTEAAYKVGTNTLLDVLEAQQDLFDAQRQYSNDVYAYLNAVLSLKQAAGTISVDDLAQINSWMVEQRSQTSVYYRPNLPKPPKQGRLAQQ